ncbi:MAG TPA: response regulator [Burkholderiales bacterium]|nr:response regulator [Burkholderiales bacterium]
MTSLYRDAPRTDRKILVVDDDSASADALAYALQCYGYATDIADDGQAALDKCSEVDPAAVVLDIKMPHMSGFEVTRRLRAMPQFSQLPIIAVTGHARAEVRSFARQAGIDKLFFKPLQAEDIEAIAGALAANARQISAQPV